MNSDLTSPPTPEDIAVCAYLIWEHEGRPEGHALQHWLHAESQLIAAHHHELLVKHAREQGAASDS